MNKKDLNYLLKENSIDDNGKLGFITSNNYFTSFSGESLRNYFQINKAIYKIIDFNHLFKIICTFQYQFGLTRLDFLSSFKNNFTFQYLF